MRRPRSARGKKGLNNPVRLALLLLFAALALAAVTWLAGKPSANLKAAGGIGRFRSFTSLWGWHKKQEEAWPETLVVYIFSNTDPEYLNNLNFFLKWGVREGDGAYYIIVVQEGGKSPLVDLEEVILPGNARLLYHDNECYDWGTLGWIMSAGIVDVDDYKHFIMINSSVRGPYAPPYQPAKEGIRKMVGLQREVPAWHKRLSERLSGEVHMVGPTISCEGTPRDGGPAAEWRTLPHVQSHAIAIDQEGLRTLQKDGNVLKCHGNHWDAKWFAELGASKAVLEAGYNLGSLMKRYEGVDWRDPSKWDCGGTRGDPFAETAGGSLSLNEALFVKIKEGTIQTSSSLAQMAAKYERWMEEQSEGENDVLAAMFPDPEEVRLPQVAAMQQRGPKCFDFAYYRSLNTDLQHYATEDALWGHFLHFGQFQRRPFRFTCDWDPPAGHDWAGYPIRADAGMQGLIDKTLDPKKQYRAIRPVPLPKVDSDFYRAQQEDSAPDAYNSVEASEEASAGLQLLQDIQQAQPQPARRQLRQGGLGGSLGYTPLGGGSLGYTPGGGSGALGRQPLGEAPLESGREASQKLAIGANRKFEDGAASQRESVDSGEVGGRHLELQKASARQAQQAFL
ncbi:g7794 [Coccomyxa elongata]